MLNADSELLLINVAYIVLSTFANNKMTHKSNDFHLKLKTDLQIIVVSLASGYSKKLTDKKGLIHTYELAILYHTWPSAFETTFLWLFSM